MRKVVLGKLTAFRQIAARLAAGVNLLAEPQDPMIGGLDASAWFEIFYDTHAGTGMGGFVRVEWPEPGGYAEQPTMVPAVMREVGLAILAEEKRNSGGK